MANRPPALLLCLLAAAALVGCAQNSGSATLSDGRGTFVKCYGDDYSGDHEPQASIDKRAACVAACRGKGFRLVDESQNQGSVTDIVTGDAEKHDTAVPAQCR